MKFVVRKINPGQAFPWTVTAFPKSIEDIRETGNMIFSWKFTSWDQAMNYVKARSSRRS